MRNLLISPAENLREDSTFSSREAEGVTRSIAGPGNEATKVSAVRQRRAAARDDGIKAFMMNFSATPHSADVPPATRDFLKAASFLFRK